MTGVQTCALPICFPVTIPQHLIESVICGIFAWGCWFILGWLGLPEGGGVLIGGMIGYLGSSTIGQWLANKFGIKGKDDNEHNDKG